MHLEILTVCQVEISRVHAEPVALLTLSCSLGMKDSWGPLKALSMATVINGVGDVVLCSLLGYGIAGAAWATMVSQVCCPSLSSLLSSLQILIMSAFMFSTI